VNAGAIVDRCGADERCHRKGRHERAGWQRPGGTKLGDGPSCSVTYDDVRRRLARTLTILAAEFTRTKRLTY
jgi:hypothetical protein